MRILAIETSSKSVSTALLDQTEVVLELDSKLNAVDVASSQAHQNAGANDSLPPGYVKKRAKSGGKTSRVFPPGASILLAPMIKSLFQKTGLPIHSVDLIAVTTGPGSFTGLRVGVVTAKALAYSTQAQIIGVNTLEAIAAQTATSLPSPTDQMRPARICAVVNAQRQQVFAGYYLSGGSLSNPDWKIDQVTPNEIFDREAWADQLQPGDIVTGPGLAGMFPEEGTNKTKGILVAPENCWACTAHSVGQLAWHQFKAGKRDSLWELEPCYFRPSAAEEVHSAKLRRSQMH